MRRCCFALSHSLRDALKNALFTTSMSGGAKGTAEPKSGGFDTNRYAIHSARWGTFSPVVADRWIAPGMSFGSQSRDRSVLFITNTHPVERGR